jgi:hypothetical protein
VEGVGEVHRPKMGSRVEEGPSWRWGEGPVVGGSIIFTSTVGDKVFAS